MTKTYKLQDLDCANCARKMEDAIRKLDGVQSANINFLTQKLTLEAEEDQFEALLEQVLDRVNALMIHLTIGNRALILTLGFGCSGITPPDSRALEALGGRIIIEADDTDTDVRIHIPRGGARQ